MNTLPATRSILRHREQEAPRYIIGDIFRDGETSWTSFNHNTSYLSGKPAEETKRSDDQTVDWAGESISPCARDAYVPQNLVIFSLDEDACINKW